jgi:geranylgeranyl reductase family protein
MLKYDVVVIGSGPAGALAALELAKNNIKVAILDKATLPRYKTCGGGLVFRGRKLLDFNLDSVIEREFKSITIAMTDSNTQFKVKRDVPIVSMVMRDKFDHFLVEKAVKEGAILYDTTKVTDISFSGKELLISTSKDTFVANFIIAADGALSPTAKIMGWKDNRLLIPALEYEVTVSDADFKRLSQELRFDLDAIPQGYGWIFPKKDHLSIGVASATRGKKDLKKYYRKYLELLDINAVINEERHGAQIPLSPREEGFFKNNVLLVGDAAGFADPITAEGISNAMYSGILAAKSISEGNLDPSKIAFLYAKKLEEKLLPELKTGRFLAEIFYRNKWLQKLIIKNYGEKFSGAMADVFLGNRSYPTNAKKRAKEYLKKIKIKL